LLKELKNQAEDLLTQEERFRIQQDALNKADEDRKQKIQMQ